MSRPSKDTIQKYPEIFRNSHFAAGPWRAKVIRVDDPESRGRIQVRVLKRHPAPIGGTPGVDAATPAGRIQTEVSTVEGEAGEGVPNPPGGFDGIPDESCPWAEPCLPFGGQKRSDATKAANGNVTDGFLMFPSVGSTVWIIYEQNWTGAPVWFGGWYGDQELPPEFTNPETIRMIKTPAGHLLIMDDGAGVERFFIATTDDDGMNVDGTRIRFIEMNDASATLTLQNAPAGDDLQILVMDRSAKTIQVQNGPDQIVTLDATLQKTTLQNSPTQKIEQDGVAGTTTITDGATIITLGPAGVITITNGTTTITVDAAGDMTIAGPGGAAISLGTGALEGVCLDSLIDVIEAAYTIFDAHIHSDPQGGFTGIPTTTMTAPSKGTNSSDTVKAKP